MKPVRDVDMIKINELCNHVLSKTDIDLETLGDFHIEQSTLVGFQAVQECILRILDTELKFLPISRSTINTVENCLQQSKVLKCADSQLMVDLTKIVPSLVNSKLIFRHSDNNVTDKVMRVTSTTTPELFHKACDN